MSVYRIIGPLVLFPASIMKVLRYILKRNTRIKNYLRLWYVFDLTSKQCISLCIGTFNSNNFADFFLILGAVIIAEIVGQQHAFDFRINFM